jgi:zinc transporter, ZIP family
MMSLTRTLVLGAFAGVTILLGMPVGRATRLSSTVKLFLNSVAIGVLLFLVWDVLSGAWEPLDAALSALHEGTGGLGAALGYGALFAAGLTVGLMGLVAYDRFLMRRRPVTSVGPGAMSVSERSGRGLASWSPARRLALMIAIGIGLHNFAEGLAIGQSAASGDVALATVLVIGFALHNATEGFGIVAPMAAEESKPTWGLLLGLAAIAGGPTVVGTLIGHGFTSDPVSVIFLTLAAGSIIYVVAQLLGVATRAKRMDVLCWGLLLGLLAGFATDAIVTAGGV